MSDQRERNGKEGMTTRLNHGRWTPEGAMSAYYEAVVGGEAPDREGLWDKVDCCFGEALTGLLPDMTHLTALDLGYGAGSYTIDLLRRGFDVEAVDIIPASHLLGRVGRLGSGAHARVVQGSLDGYTPNTEFAPTVLVARHSLHFVGVSAVRKLVGGLADYSSAAGGARLHFIVMFTDIWRRNGAHGSIPPGFSKAEWLAFVDHAYHGWVTTLSTRSYQNVDASGDAYFKAVEVSLLATSTGGDPVA